MIRRKRFGLALAATLLIMTSYVISSTMATKVTPEKTKVKATLVANGMVRFLFENASGKESVRCKKSTIETESPSSTPNNDNVNRPKVGTYSRTPGSVLMKNTQLPKFEECDSYVFKGLDLVKESAATVTATGTWSASARVFKAGQEVPILVFAMPAQGIQIKIGGRTLNIAPAGAESVVGRYENSTGKLFIDSQHSVEEVGKGVSTLQVEVDYDVSPKLKLEF